MSARRSTARGFLAVSVAPGGTCPPLDAATKTLEALGDAVVVRDVGQPGDVIPLAQGVRAPAGAFAPPTDDVWAEIVPPGAAAWSASTGWCAASDAAGLYHLYWRQADGWAAMSTSAVALGRLERPAPNREALGVVALAGHALGNSSVVDGVYKLDAGEVCHLRDGRAEITDRRPPRRLADAWVTDSVALRRSGAETVRTIVRDALEREPAPVLELSGGLDSRVVLAAIPRERRRGLPAFTLGPPGSEDVVVASEIARSLGLEHRWIDMQGLARLAPEEAEQLVVSAGRQVDWAGNPLALAALSWAESRVDDDRPRLSGQNGEFGRGFYYALLPRWLPNSDSVVRGLGRWRVLANDQVDPGLLRPDQRAHAEEAALSALRELVPRGPLLPATDELYLEMRMARWLGPVYTLASRSRIVLAPFLDDRYLAWVRATNPTRRRGSRALASVLEELDPDLASLSLAGGTAPRVLAAGGLRAARATAPAFARKVVAKARQRLRPRPRAPVGAGLLAQRVQQAWADRSGALEAAAASPLVRAEIVEEIARGNRPADAATVGYLVALDHLERMSPSDS